MIENKSEIIPVITLSKDKLYEREDFFSFINDKKNGHGEDVSIAIVNSYPELYHEHIHSAGRSVFFVSRRNQSHSHGIVPNDMLLSQQKKHILLIATLRENENDSGSQGRITLKNSGNISLESTTASNSEKLNYTGKDEYKELNTETKKACLPYVQLKNDVLSNRQELSQQDMQPRRPQSSVADNLSNTRIDMITKPAAIQNKSLDFDYSFLRWPGEHSVKVSIPVGLSPSRHLTLLPSDPRLAEMLSRQASQLIGFTTELLYPLQDDEESERRDFQYNEEKDKE